MMAYDLFHPSRELDFQDTAGDTLGEPTSLFEEYLNADSFEYCEEGNDRLADFNFGLDKHANNDSVSAAAPHPPSSERHLSAKINGLAPTATTTPKSPSDTSPNKTRSHRNTIPRALQLNAVRQAAPTPEVPRSPPKSSSPLKSSFPALRRKAGKIFGGDKKSEAPTQQGQIPPHIVMGPYGMYDAGAAYGDWTRQFEQISLQQPEAFGGQLPSPAMEEPPETCPPFAQYLRADQQKVFQEHMLQRQRMQAAKLAANNEHYTMPVQAGAIADDMSSAYTHLRQSPNRPRHARQPASWSPMPTPHYDHELVSPSHLHNDWEHMLQQEGNDEIYGNGLQTTSLPSYSPTEFTMNFSQQPPYTATGASFPPEQLQHPPQGQASQQPSPTRTHNSSYGPSSPTRAAKSGRPCTPPSRAGSPPLDTPTSARSMRNNKRRSAKIGTLRLPKSSGNLKSTKSMRDLRSPKSATNLKSSKSTAGLRSLGEFGFVNFTPEDKGKILTGVAPSGSSKTKARREQEAFDKKRRLSEAAEKAILQAGGNPDALRLEGLL